MEVSERAPSTYWIGAWLGPKDRLDAVGKKRNLALLEIKHGLYGQ
jgi:hypothetical protein